MYPLTLLLFFSPSDLKLVHAPGIRDDTDLDIHARTTIRYGYSFIESAAIRIGSDVLEVSSWGEYAINSVEGADPATGLGGFPLHHTQLNKKQHKFDIVLAPDSNITIGNMKDLVSVKIGGSHYSMFNKVSGLWGDFFGRMLARDGVTNLGEAPNAMGQEWQVRDDEAMLFRNARAPQYPVQCILPNVEQNESRRLGQGISEGTAKAACAHLKADEHAFHNCIYDVTATNDIDMADAGAM